MNTVSYQEVIDHRRELFSKTKNLDHWEMHFDVLTVDPFRIWFEHRARPGLQDYIGLDNWLSEKKEQINDLYGHKALRPFTQVGTQLTRAIRIITDEYSGGILRKWSEDGIASLAIDRSIGRMAVDVETPDRFFHDTSSSVWDYGGKTMLATVIVAEMQATELDEKVA